MYLTNKDIDTFRHEPEDYIRNFYDFKEELFEPRHLIQGLLMQIIEQSESKAEEQEESDQNDKEEGVIVNKKSEEINNKLFELDLTAMEPKRTNR